MSDGFRFGAVPTRAIRDPRVSDAQLRVLAELATYADPEGWCNPKQTTMAKNLGGVTRQAISKHVRALVDLGYILVRPSFREDGSQASNEYCVRLDPATSEVAGGQPNAVAGGSTSGVAPPSTSGVAPGTDHSTDQRTDTPAAPTPVARKRSPRDDLFDALVLAFGPASTPSRASFYGKTVTELVKAGATPDQVKRARIAMSRRGWNDPTPQAMLTHWDDLLKATTPTSVDFDAASRRRTNGEG